MSKAEILAELPKLSEQDRGEILEQLWRLEETAGPTSAEISLLEDAQGRYEIAPDAGSPWTEVNARLRRRA